MSKITREQIADIIVWLLEETQHHTEEELPIKASLLFSQALEVVANMPGLTEELVRLTLQEQAGRPAVTTVADDPLAPAKKDMN